MTPPDERSDNPLGRRQAVLYARCASSLDGWGQVTAQLRSCRQLGAELDLEVVRSFVDRGASGLRLDRPGLTQLLACVAQHRVDYVICADDDRLSRSYPLYKDLVGWLQARGVLIITVQDAVERYPALAESVKGRAA